MAASKSFVFTFNEGLQQFEMCSISDADLAPLRAKSVVAPWRLEAMLVGELTEHIASRVGAVALGILSIYHPEVKQRLKIKPDQFPLPWSPGDALTLEKVRTPEQQQFSCGALRQHRGDRALSSSFATRNGSSDRYSLTIGNDQANAYRPRTLRH